MTSGLPLDTLAIDIKARLKRGDDYLASAAIMLAEAKERVEKGEAPGHEWKGWCVEKLGRTADDAQRLIGYVRSGQLPEKLEKRRSQNRISKQKHDAAKKSGLRKPGAAPKIYGDPEVEEPLFDTPENYRTAFLIRADQAGKFAIYTGPVTPELVKVARSVAMAWRNLAKSMETKLTPADAGISQEIVETPMSPAVEGTARGENNDRHNQGG